MARGRLLGLRREEVACGAGVSVTWYTWLEQGRDINPSRQVLDAVARAMRLTPKRAYVLGLGGYVPGPAAEPAADVPAPPHLRRLLDSLSPAPAFAIAPDWTIVAWNAGCEALYPGVAAVRPDRRNLLRFVFTDAYVRRMLPDWEVTSRHFLAEYRAGAGPRLLDPRHVALVDSLLADPDFRAAWEEHRIERFASRERRFRHPAAGELVFEQHRLTPDDAPGLHVVGYLPATAGDAARLRDLLASAQR